MAKFFEPAKVQMTRVMRRGLHTVMIIEDFPYETDALGEPKVFTINKKFKTDFATIPRLARWWKTPFGLHAEAAIVHDWLCTKKVVPRKTADAIFYEAMLVLGVSKFDAWIMWAFVRMSAKLKGLG